MNNREKVVNEEVIITDADKRVYKEAVSSENLAVIALSSTSFLFTYKALKYANTPAQFSNILSFG